MPEFCTCGAQLPPDARFCHKCGKPQYDYPSRVDEPEPEPEPAPTPPLVMPSVSPTPEIGFHNGIAVRIGFIAAVAAVFILMIPLPFPLARLLVAFLAAGFLAVFLYSRRTGQILTVRGGARMGWITGIFSFMLVSILFTVAMVVVSNEGGLAKYIRSQLPPNDANSETLTQAFGDPATLVALMLFSLLVLFILLTALPIIGGALGAKVLDKE